MPDTLESTPYWLRILAKAQEIMLLYPNWSGDEAFNKAVQQVNGEDFALEAQQSIRR